MEDLQQQAIRNGAVKKKDEKLDWMYAGGSMGGAAANDEYLLGKKVGAKKQKGATDLVLVV